MKPGTFPPGQSGNPNGRPKKGVSIRGCLREAMAEILELPQKDGSMKRVTKGEFLSQKLFQIASTGDLSAIKMCLDNVDGPPTQAIEHTGPGGSALSLVAQISGAPLAPTYAQTAIE